MTPIDSPYKPVPVATAKAIAEEFDKSIVIICAHDPVFGLLHVTTYGTDPQNKAWAAKGGEIANAALGGLRQAATDFEDYRLIQAHKLLAALKEARPYVIGADAQRKVNETIAKAEEFLGATV